MAVYQKLQGFRGDSAFRTWLLAIAWRKALDRRRSVSRWLRMTITHDRADGDERDMVEQMPDTSRSQEDVLSDEDLQRTVKRLIGTLPRKLRDALVARRLRRLLLRADRLDAGHSGGHGEMASLGGAAAAEEEARSNGIRI